MANSNYLIIFIILAALWTIPWKAVALWKAARNGHKIWFVILLIINTLAILEILYIFIFSRKRKIEEKINSNNIIRKPIV